MFTSIALAILLYFTHSDASQSFFDFEAIDIKGNLVSFSEFKGKVGDNRGKYVTHLFTPTPPDVDLILTYFKYMQLK